MTMTPTLCTAFKPKQGTAWQLASTWHHLSGNYAVLSGVICRATDSTHNPDRHGFVGNAKGNTNGRMFSIEAPAIYAN